MEGSKYLIILFISGSFLQTIREDYEKSINIGYLPKDRYSK